MKKIPLVFLILSTFMLNMSIVHANTYPPAIFVTSTIPGSPKCVNGSATNVQAYLNQVDQCFGTISAGLTFTDGSHTVANATQLTVSGGTIGGTTPNATLSITATANPGSPVNSFQYNNAGTFAGGNMYETSGGNIGIGTSVPAATFDVEGTLSTTTFAGNVGIGTTTPTKNFVVQGNTNGSVGMLFQNLNAGTLAQSGFDIYNNQGNGFALVSTGSNFTPVSPNLFGIFTTPGYSFNIGNQNGNIYQTIDGNGNVGIGTTATPLLFTIQTAQGPLSLDYSTSTLIVHGAGTFTGNGGTITMQEAPAPSNPSLGNDGIYISNTDSLVHEITNLGKNYPLVQWFPENNGIYAPGNVGIGSQNPGQSLDVLGTVRSTGFIATGAQSTFVANVGIGTVVPIRILDVVSSDTNTSLTTASLPSIGIENLNNATPNNIEELAFSTTDSNSAPALAAKISVINTSHTANAVNGALAFLTRNTGTTTEDMRIVGGNVGIGSTAPGQRLDINGTARMTGFNLNSSSGTGYVLTDSTGTGNGTWQASTGGSTGWTVSGNNVYQTSSGNVGIGTAIPFGKLDVEGTNTYSSFYAASYSSGSNVGIGSFSPGQRLDVNGTVRMTGFQLGTSATAGYLLTAGANGTGTYQAAPLSSQWSGTSGNPINYAYNVGLGSSTPAGQLDVEGTNTPAVFFASSISTASNMGIGSYNPGYKLDVGSTIRDLGEVVNGTGTSNFTTNVGVGSATPGAILDVQGTARFLGVNAGSNSFYYCNGGVDVNLVSRGSSCLCPSGTCVQINISGS
jgi:hypothetical protein